MPGEGQPDVTPRTAAPRPIRPPVLDAVLLTKHFGGVTALDDVSLWALAGEVTALVGENGAGKSTLIKCLSGVYQPDSGEIRIDEKPMKFASPLDARLAGIETVYQELGLVEYFDVAMNIFLGREICHPWWQGSMLDRRAMRRRAREVLAGFGITNVDPSTEVRQLSGGQRQGVSIARATAWGARTIIMDEPTAALGVRESERVMDVIRKLRDANLCVLIVSHNIPQVLAVADRIWVLRAGRLVAHRLAGETNHADIVGHITGMTLARFETQQSKPVEQEVILPAPGPIIGMRSPLP
jgi:simple sugar transport system ATP-binding protein